MCGHKGKKWEMLKSIPEASVCSRTATYYFLCGLKGDTPYVVEVVSVRGVSFPDLG